MRDRALWVIVAFMVLLIAALLLWPVRNPRPATAGPSLTTTTPKSAGTTTIPPAVVTPAVAAPARPAPAVVATTVAAPPISAEKKPKPEVAIQDGKTIDFSTGVAVVKDDAKQKAAIDQSVKEMESALQNVTFSPPGQKKAEPTPAPPKP